MSFSNIKDPLEAQKKFEDYMRIKAELKREFEEKRESQSIRDASLEAEYRPVTQSQAEMTKKIVQAIEKRKQNEVKEEVKEEPRKNDVWNVKLEFLRIDIEIDMCIGMKALTPHLE